MKALGWTLIMLWLVGGILAVGFSGCVAAPKVDLEAKARFDTEMKALSDIQANVLTDITATNEIAAVVKKQEQATEDGGIGNEHGIGIGANGTYYGGAELLALLWALERLGYWLLRWRDGRPLPAKRELGGGPCSLS